MLTVLVGGARSGKSSLAVELGHRHDGDVVVIANGPRIAGDDDLDRRIAAHRAERPAHWTTVEEEHDLAGALGTTADGALVVVDCLTLWVANLVWRGDSDEAVAAATREATEVAARRSGPTVVVTNEVGLGIVPAAADTRRYRDLLGRVNQHWAAAADRTVLLVAGRAVELHDPLAVLA